MVPLPADVTPDYVLTLVHGTWADTSGWVSPGSALRRHLEERLPGVVFREFPWSGANTHEARLEAGARLGRFIREGQALHPAARHFIVAHSHGGNVALYAMRDPAARDAVDGIVTLATPFFFTRRRRVRRHIPFFTSLLLAAPAVLGFVLLYARSRRLAAAWLLAALLLGLRVQPLFARRVMAFVRRRQAAIVAALQPPSVDRSRLLILCTRRDEARGWLDAWDVLTQAPFIAGGLLLSLLNALSSGRLYAIVADALGTLGWRLMLGSVAAAAIGGVWLLCSGLMRWPAYWREPLGANLFVQIGTDRIPRGGVTRIGETMHAAQAIDLPAHVPLRPAGRLSRIKRRRLLHTAICDDEPALSAVADWIATMQVRSRSGSRRQAAWVLAARELKAVQ